jgi:hypothetical protein
METSGSTETVMGSPASGSAVVAEGALDALEVDR